jgi:hypothetical protein
MPASAGFSAAGTLLGEREASEHTATKTPTEIGLRSRALAQGQGELNIRFPGYDPRADTLAAVPKTFPVGARFYLRRVREHPDSLPRTTLTVTSQSKRSVSCELPATCDLRILMATGRSIRVSRARHTSLMPPAPWRTGSHRARGAFSTGAFSRIDGRFLGDYTRRTATRKRSLPNAAGIRHRHKRSAVATSPVRNRNGSERLVARIGNEDGFRFPIRLVHGFRF